MGFRRKAVYYFGAAIASVCLTLTLFEAQAASGRFGTGQKGELVSGETADGSTTFSVGLGAGYMTGESKELVFWPEYNNHKASELTWEIDSQYLINVTACISFLKDWSINFNGYFSATDGEGTMDDYDWANVGGDWTDWSHHDDTDVTSVTMLDINGAWKFINKPIVGLSFILGFKRDSFNWDAYGGDYVYTDSSFRDTTGSFDPNELVISYEQTFWAVYVGFGFNLNFNKVVSLSGRAIYSPLVQCEAIDHHYMRNLITHDDFNGGDLFAADIKASFNITRTVAVDVGYAYLHYDEMQDDSVWYYNDYDLVLFYRDAAGTDHSSSVISILLRYTFY